MNTVKKKYKINKFQKKTLKQKEMLVIKNYNKLLLIKMKYINLIHKQLELLMKIHKITF